MPRERSESAPFVILVRQIVDNTVALGIAYVS